MAKRYSGAVTIRIQWSDVLDEYEARVTMPGTKGESIRVRAPAVLERAVDSPDEYDSAARAALSFASEEFGQAAEYDECHAIMRRSPAREVRS